MGSVYDGRRELQNKKGINMKQKPILLIPPAGRWIVELTLGRAGVVTMSFPTSEMANAVYRELQGQAIYQGHWITASTIRSDTIQ